MVYSLDLRKKALNYIAKGGTRSDASTIFGVTTRTLANWLCREKQNDLAPKMNGSRPSKINDEKLKKYIEDNPDSYLREIAKEFSSTLQAVFYACKRIKITLKKNRHSTKKEMNKKGKNLKRN
jgi:transposase